MEKGEQKMNEFKEYLLAENDKLRQENIRLHDKVNELSEDVGYYKGVVNTNGYLEDRDFKSCGTDMYTTKKMTKPVFSEI